MSSPNKQLWLAVLVSVALTLSTGYYAYHCYRYKNLDDIYLSANEYDVRIENLNSIGEISELKALHFAAIKHEKELASIMRGYFELMFKASAILLFLACVSSGCWVVCVRAYEKEKPLK